MPVRSRFALALRGDAMSNAPVILYEDFSSPRRRELVGVGGEQEAFGRMASALAEAVAVIKPDDVSCEIDRASDGTARFRFRAYRK